MKTLRGKQVLMCPGIVNTNIVNTPGTTAPGITDAQLEKLRRYYHEHGCLPAVVAEGVVRSVLGDDLYLFVGPRFPQGRQPAVAGLRCGLRRIRRRAPPGVR